MSLIRIFHRLAVASGFGGIAEVVRVAHTLRQPARVECGHPGRSTDRPGSQNPSHACLAKVFTGPFVPAGEKSGFDL
jgi:hypothetical protein